MTGAQYRKIVLQFQVEFLLEVFVQQQVAVGRKPFDGRYDLLTRKNIPVEFRRA